MSLPWRIFAVNAAVLLAAAIALALSPATVSADLLVREIGLLVLGMAFVLAVNFLLVRRVLRPLERLNGLMQRVDLTRPGARLPVTDGGPEVGELTRSFNEMLSRLERERRDSGARAIQAQEQERRRIALELHDEVGQLLTGVVLALDGLARSAPEVRERATELQDMVREGAERVRELAQGLRPDSLEELGLRSALIGLVVSVADRAPFEIERRIARDLPPLPPDAELVVYRVAQESLTNVVRHAGARQVEVTFEPAGGALVLRVADDGCGIEPGDMPAARGLAGMAERALYVGGRLDVARRSPRGTEVVLTIPMEEPAR